MKGKINNVAFSRKKIISEFFFLRALESFIMKSFLYVLNGVVTTGRPFPLPTCHDRGNFEKIKNEKFN